MGIKQFIQKLGQLNLFLAVEEDRLVLKRTKKQAAGDVATVTIDEEIVRYIKLNKSDLIQYLSEQEELQPVIKGEGIVAVYRLSALQEGLLFHSLYDSSGGAYIEQFSCELEGLEESFFVATWQHLVQQHSILRSGFYEDEFNVMVQCVYKKVTVPLVTLDYSEHSPEEQQQLLKKYIAADSIQGFHLKAAPLMRFTLIHLGANKCQLIWTFHHLILDGWSTSILMGEFLEIYELFSQGKAPVAKAEDKYEDYIRVLADNDKHAAEQYWRNYLKDLSTPCLLPFIREGVDRTKGVALYRQELLSLDKQLSKKIDKYCRTHRITVNTFMQGIWAYLLHGYTGKEEVVYGITVSTRPDDLPDMESRVGMYTNTLPLYTTILPEQPVADWFRQLQEDQVQSRGYQYSSLSEMQVWTGIGGDLFDTMITFQNYPVSEVIKSKQWQLEVKDVEIIEQTSNYPLSLRIMLGDVINIQFIYKEAVIDGAVVKSVTAHFEHILQQLLAGTASNLGDLRLLTAAEEATIRTFNNNRVDFGTHTHILELIAAQVARNGSATAVVYEQQELSYETLWERSGQLANYLAALGVGREVPVAVLVNRGFNMLVSMLAILRAGGAYVPLEPTHPAERLRYMLEDTGAVIVLTDYAQSERLADVEGLRLVDIEDLEPLLSQYPATVPEKNISGKDLGYIIYTSGSTGRPKGVMIQHEGILNMVQSHIRILSLTPGLRILQFASYGFDGSCQEIFNTLCSGGTLIVASPAEILSASLLGALLQRERVDIATLPPSYQILLKEQLGSLKILYSAGEALHAEVAAYVQSQGVTVVNGYGPTENTVTVTLSRQPLRADGQVTIGAPIPNVSVYILDKAGRLCPVGVHGELYVGGVQVARGYVNNEAETAQKFIANPYGEGRLYRTGDTGCWLSDGTIAYKGRSDDQLKIRGYRIETGEVERVLQRAPGVEQGVVVAAGTVAAGQYLAAYIITGDSYSKEAVKEYLAQYLPEYMIPSAINVVDAFPLTSSSKINRKLLAQTAVGVSENNYAAATNQLEADLCRIWEELLEKEQISIDDDFFELGGHSLLGIRMISAIRKHLSLESDIREVFDYPTIRTLAAQLRSRNEGSLYPVISARDSYGKLPLSYSQEQLWFVDRLQGSREYYMPYVYSLSGELDVAAFCEALHTIVYRHEILRTVIVEENGGVYQQVEAGADWSVTYETFDNGIPDNYISSLVNRPLDLSRDRMFNVWLLRESPTKHVLVALMHHIVFDGWSMSILINELSSLYVSRIRGTESGLLPLPVQYKDYALWQREHLTAAVMSGKINYWKEQLKGLIPLSLPADYPRPATQSIRGATITSQLGESVLNRLEALSKEEGTTLFMTLLSAFQVLLYRYTGQQDIYVGSPIAGRHHHELESLIGFFVNTLICRIEVRGGETYTSLLSRVKEMMLQAYANQEVPFEKMVEVAGQRRDLSRHPLFDVKFQLENMPSAGDLDLGGLTLQGYEGIGGNAQMDLSLDIRQSADGLLLSFTYCTDLFDAATIERMQQHYEYLLLDILKDRRQVVDQLQLLSPLEKDQLLFEFNDTFVDTGDDRTITDVFAGHVALNPAATAIVYGEESLSYGELDKQSNRVAQYLRKKGVVEDELVAICLDRSLDMVVAMLGILKAGAAYVPVDPSYPASRIDYIITDTKTKIVLSNDAYADNFRTHKGVEVLDMNNIVSWPGDYQDTPVTTNLRPDHLAYVIYTSGSTGRPKGVMIEHRGVVNLVHSQTKPLGLRPGIKVLQFASFSFDASCYEIFCTLLSGGQLVLVSKETIADPVLFSQILREQEIALVTLPPGYQSTLKHPLPALKRIVSAGEALDKRILAELVQHGITVINAYGPTENTVCATLSETPVTENGTVTIGKPLSNVQAYILDHHLNLLPVGVPGELCLAGIQVARGYLHQPELTAAKFVNNPYGAGRLYHTGDQARWLPDGNIEYLGRRDEQVKVRGYRIEPGEVESAINELPEILTSAVVVKRDVTEDNKLVCYYVPSGEAVREKERGLYEKHVSGWQELYEAEYSEENNNASSDETFDIRGWNDSFTGTAISAADMKAWLDDIITVATHGHPRRVMELGCGSGLLYYRLRNTIAHYTGSDISAASVNGLRKKLAAENRDYCETELYVKPAHESLPVKDGDIDTLILNSIVQYFPSAAYLTTVIGTHLPRLSAGGRIIIGDVRDNRLLKLFHSRKALLSLQDSAGLEEFDWFVSQGVEREEELCLSPEYFYGLKDLYPRITHVEIFWKNGDFHNELSLYRYTVVLHTDEVPVLSMPSWQPWNASPDADTLLAEIASAGTLTGLLDVPNPRLYLERHLQSALGNRSITAVGDLSGISTMSEEEQQVLALLSAATARGYYCQLQLQADALRMNVVLCRENIPYACEQYYHATPTGDIAASANSPLFMESSLALQKDIRTALEARLPEYMIPAELIPLQHMPLTLNGKTDRKFLASRDDIKVTGKIYFEAPVGALEKQLAAIWEELLAIPEIGRHDDVFELGGHSLMVIRAVSAIRKTLGLEVAIKQMFDYPTVHSLAEVLKNTQQEAVTPPIAIADSSKPLPLSFPQERLWFIDKLKGSVQYHMPWVFKLKGSIHAAHLEAAFRDVLHRHQVLRTLIQETAGNGYQVILETAGWNMRCLTAADIMAANITLDEYIHEVLNTPFDLAADFMLRVHLISTGADEYLLVAVTHHIAFDGWSLSLLVEELMEGYRSRQENRPAIFKDLPVQYADYAAWQRTYLTPAMITEKLSYWKTQLHDLQPLALLTDYPRPAQQSVTGAQLSKLYPVSLKNGLLALSQQEGVTLFMTLLAAFKVLLFRYTGQSSVQVGTPVAGRQQQETEGLIGFFVNMLVLKSNVSSDMTFTGLLKNIRATTLAAYEHQDVPFEKVVEALGLERDMSRHPLFDVKFQVLNTPETRLFDLGNVSLQPVDPGAVTAQMDISLDITEQADGLHIQVVYSSHLYTHATIERLLQHYEQLLSSILAAPAMPIGILRMLPPAEENALLISFNAASWHDEQHTIVSLFEQQVLRIPDATAILFEDTAMSYRVLNERANQLARYLQWQGVAHETPVGVCMDKCPEMMIAILAILKAGGAYVPVDPEYPSGRIHYMISDTGNGLVLTDSRYRELLQDTGASLIYLDEIGETIHNYDTSALPPVASADSLAYMMYTSGSTGQPKGVAVTQRNVVSLVTQQSYAPAQPGAVLLSTGSVSFDATTFEYWMMLLHGGQLLLCPAPVLLDTRLLKAQIRAHGVTMMWFTAGWFNELVESDPDLFAGLKRILVGGDRLSAYYVSLLQGKYPALEIINGYGPTENTTFSVTHHIRAVDVSGGSDIPIGRPLSGRSVYVLDAQQQLCGIGIAGELYVGGTGLSRGYHHAPELTAAKFVANPFGEGRLYRTGDQVKWLPDGLLAYLGRIDEQVKIRGYRVEPAEVEWTLQQARGVKQAVVLVDGDSAAEKQLVAYVEGENITPASLQTYLQQLLPGHMIPSRILILEHIPLTENGKVNRAFLRTLSLPVALEHEYTAPRNAIESQLADIWQSLLGVERIGIYENFFECGGHSLLAIRVISAVRKELNKELSIKELFDGPTIAEIAALLLPQEQANNHIAIRRYEREKYIPLSFSQERVWFIDKLQGSVQYHMPYIFRLSGSLDVAAFEWAFSKIIERHEVLRTVIREEDGKGYQVIRDNAQWRLDCVNESDILPVYGTTDEYIAAMIQKPFDLSADFMLRGCLVKIQPEEFILVMVMHHIAFDGWSIAIMVNELLAGYHQKTGGSAVAPAPLPVQYADYAIWQRKALSPELLNNKLQYWKKHLSGLEPLLLTTDYPRASNQGLAGASVSCNMSGGLVHDLNTLAKQEDATLFMVLLSAFMVLLQRYTGRQSVHVGTTVAGRHLQEVEQLIGFFVNTLVLKAEVEEEVSFTTQLKHVKDVAIGAYSHQDVPFEKVVEVLGVERDISRNPVFQVMFSLQNMPEAAALDFGEVSFEKEGRERTTSLFDISLDILESAEGLSVTITYCTDLFHRDTITRMLSHYSHLLHSITKDPHSKVKQLDILPPAEKALLLNVYNNHLHHLPYAGTVLDMIQVFTQSTPDAVALIWENEQLTYAALDRRVNQLAHYLVNKGVTPETLVPVLLERGMALIVSILGVLKAGAAYVPLDPAYPVSRIAAMLTDVSPHLIISSDSCKEKVPPPYQANLLLLNNNLEALNDWPANNPVVALRREHLAYVIYTSGSTGVPKGVMIEHAALADYISSQGNYMQITNQDRVLQFSNFCFDASLEQIFLALGNGATLVLVAEHILLDGDLFDQFLADQQITHLHATPGFLSTLKGNRYALKRVVSGGDICPPALAAQWKDQVAFYNEYGPTETTITAIEYCVPRDSAELSDNLPIGKPVSGTQVYILDASNELCVPGIPGELCIAGAGLARGYLNDAALTASRFIANPFGPGRLYRTGDIARWLPDGNLAYLGRSDDQVKIRGYRIETGEVETVLGNSPGVKQAVVVATTDTTASRRLIGFIVKDAAYDKEGVLAYLSSQLPPYMIPSLLVELESIPLTTNGKVDRKQLAAYALPASAVSPDFVLPRNAVEKTLAAIWEGLLGISGVGVYDNFFELGGDSIITIQVVSRARREGIILQPRDIFEHQDIASLSAYLAHRGQVAAQEGEQGILTGNSGLLPVQQWYLGNNGDNEHISHFNQGVLLRIAKSVSADTLRRVAGLLTARHDALGFRYSQTAAGEWEQSYSGGSDAFVVADLQHVDAALLSEAITHSSQQYQESLDITAGPIFRMVLLLTPAAEAHHRLLLVVHHLAVDGVSWRILLEDLDAMLTALQGGQAYAPLAKTSSYREWYQALSAHGFSSQLPYWERISAGYEPLRGEKERVRHGDMARHAVHFSAAQTKYLLQEVPRIYQTEVNDLLLYALCRSLTSWSGHARVHIGLEGHGREALPGTDLSRTVGWFTTMYPVMLETTHDNTRDNLLSIKEQLRQIPEKGIGYGVLKYIHGAAGLSGKDPWDLVFNYLGQSDNVIQKSDWLSGAAESGGQSINDGIYSNALIEVNSIISGGSLQMNWSYNRAHYSESDIAALSTAYFACLDELIAHCTEQGNNNIPYAIPADYGLSGDVSYEELNGFLSGMEGGVARRTLLSGVYRLSPLQEGLLFHGLYDETGGAYIEQFRCEVGALDERAFIRSWEHLLSQHSILRSSFYAAVFNIPVQAVHHQCTLPLQKLDYRGKSEEEQQSLIAAYLQADREAGFNFQQAPLMRVALIQLAENRYQLIWTSHHLILDGWSVPILMEEFLQAYDDLLDGKALIHYAEDRYDDYIRYIGNKDRLASVNYWREYLKKITSACLLPFVQEEERRTKGVGTYKELPLLLDESVTGRINTFCRKHHITVNTLMQGVWSYLLHRYTGSTGITYGVTVSGRPEDMPDIERKIGLYINTLLFQTEVPADADVLDWLLALQESQSQSRLYQYASLADIQRSSGIGGALFDTMITFQNYPVSKVIDARVWKLQVDKVFAEEQTNYLLSLLIGAADQISVRFNYNEDLLATGYVEQISRHFEKVVLAMISQDKQQIKQLEIQQTDLFHKTGLPKKEMLFDFE